MSEKILPDHVTADLMNEATNVIRSGTKEATAKIVFLVKNNDNIREFPVLNDDSSPYLLEGSWHQTPRTKIKKFRTNAREQDIMVVTTKALGPIRREGDFIHAIFAVDSTGKHRHIITNETELYPNC